MAKSAFSRRTNYSDVTGASTVKPGIPRRYTRLIEWEQTVAVDTPTKPPSLFRRMLME